MLIGLYGILVLTTICTATGAPVGDFVASDCLRITSPDQCTGPCALLRYSIQINNSPPLMQNFGLCYERNSSPRVFGELLATNERVRGGGSLNAKLSETNDTSIQLIGPPSAVAMPTVETCRLVVADGICTALFQVDGYAYMKSICISKEARNWCESSQPSDDSLSSINGTYIPTGIPENCISAFRPDECVGSCGMHPAMFRILRPPNGDPFNYYLGNFYSVCYPGQPPALGNLLHPIDLPNTGMNITGGFYSSFHSWSGITFLGKPGLVEVPTPTTCQAAGGNAICVYRLTAKRGSITDSWTRQICLSPETKWKCWGSPSIGYYEYEVKLQPITYSFADLQCLSVTDLSNCTSPCKVARFRISLGSTQQAKYNFGICNNPDKPPFMIGDVQLGTTKVLGTNIQITGQLDNEPRFGVGLLGEAALVNDVNYDTCKLVGAEGFCKLTITVDGHQIVKKICMREAMKFFFCEAAPDKDDGLIVTGEYHKDCIRRTDLNTCVDECVPKVHTVSLRYKLVIPDELLSFLRSNFVFRSDLVMSHERSQRFDSMFGLCVPRNSPPPLVGDLLSVNEAFGGTHITVESRLVESTSNPVLLGYPAVIPSPNIERCNTAGAGMCTLTITLDNYQMALRFCMSPDLRIFCDEQNQIQFLGKTFNTSLVYWR